MGTAAVWLRAELRRRWRRQLALALLVGLVGGVVLVCAAGARRTVSAHDRFAAAQALPDIELQASVMTPEGLDRVATSIGYYEVVFRWARGTDVALSSDRLRLAFLLDSVAVAPPDVASLDLIKGYPGLLAAFLSLLALLALVHSLVVSVRSRRRQLAVLRAVGLTRGQVVRAVAVQGLAIAAVGVLVGTPVGVALGRAVWQVHADRLGVAVAQRVPAGLLALAAVATVLVAAAIAIITGSRATRSTPGASLRGE